MIDSRDGEMQFRGKTWERFYFEESESVMWTNEKGKFIASFRVISRERLVEGSYRTMKVRRIRGNVKLCRKLERLWARRNENVETSQKAHSDEDDEATEKLTAITEGKSRKASDGAAIFESTDPRYCLKLFSTLSKKFPGHVNLHLYQNPKRRHQFYTVRIEEAIRETEKFLAQLRLISEKKS